MAELLLHMMLTAVLLGPLVEWASMTLEDPWELESPPSQDQLLKVQTLEQQDSHLDLLETPWSEPAYWEGPAKLVEVEDVSMLLVLEVLGLVLEEL